MSTLGRAPQFSDPQAIPGSGYQQMSQQQYTPQQMQLFQQMFGNISPGSYLSRLAGGDEGTFRQMEAPAMRQFGELQGNIASRFSGMGSRGGRRSSGFQNTMTQAGSDFAEQLQSRRQGLQQQAIRDLMSMSGQLLGERPYETTLLPQQKPFWQEMLTAAAGGVGQGLGSIGTTLALL